MGGGCISLGTGIGKSCRGVKYEFYLLGKKIVKERREVEKEVMSYAGGREGWLGF